MTSLAHAKLSKEPRRRKAARVLVLLTHRMVWRTLAPLRAMRPRYLPLLMIYFASGASMLSGVAETFFVKDRLDLSAEALVTILVWVTVPWSIKPLFGQLVDCVPLFGSRRRIYVFLGASLVAFSYVMLAGLAGGWVTFASPGTIYAVASVLTVIGLVIQDTVADAMSTEVVPRKRKNGEPRSEEDINADLGMIQVLGRIAYTSGTFAVAGLGGWLAQILSYEDMFLLALIVPAISLVSSLLLRVEMGERPPLDRRIVLGGIAFAVTAIGVAASRMPFAQEFIFALSLGIVLYLVWQLIEDIDAETRRRIIYASALIFVFRAMPSYGPGAQWWQIDVLGFDPAFFGTLNQWSAAIGIVGTWMFSHAVNHKPIPVVLFVLTIVGPALSFPSIGMYYGLHEWTERMFGFGARTIAIVDVSMSSPFIQLSAIPMLTLIAVHAPPGKRATWFALMAALMNIALQASGLATKYLNKLFVVERGDYANLGHLMVASTLISLVLPLLALGLVARRIKLGAAAGPSEPKPWEKI